MRFTVVILSAMLCLNARAESAPADQDSDEAIMAAAEKLVDEGKTLKTETPVEAKATTPAAELAQEAKKESEIPVFVKTEKTAKSEANLIWRLVGSLALIAVVGGSLLYATRRWNRKANVGGQKARIEIIHQFHLGPRKSVALIQVAGEALLIGCTDHSINMLKSVTLIDDELEGVMGQNFNNFLEDDFRVEDMRTALSQRV